MADVTSDARSCRIPSPTEVLAEVGPALGASGRVVLCHIVRVEGSTSGKPGWRLMVRGDGTTFGNLGGGSFEALVTADARRLLEGGEARVERYYLTEKAVRGQPTGMACGGMAEVFLERLELPPVLLVYGGGPVGQALARAAGPAGFELTVLDDREEFRRPELFPDGTSLPEVDRTYRGGYLCTLAGKEAYVAVVSRCWETDTAALAAVLEAPPQRLRYLGLMGSLRKVERVRSKLLDRGLDPGQAPFHAPIGLDLGGDTPGEIAVSIVAQLLRVRHRRAGQGEQEDGDTQGRTGRPREGESVDQEARGEKGVATVELKTSRGRRSGAKEPSTAGQLSEEQAGKRVDEALRGSPESEDPVGELQGVARADS